MEMYQKRKPIAAYCKQEVEGWERFSDEMNCTHPGEEEYTCSFFRRSDGITLMASVKNLNVLNLIHISLCPLRCFRKDWSDEEHCGHMFDVTFEVVNSFFPGRKFARQPDDPRSPQMKHYFAILEANE